MTSSWPRRTYLGVFRASRFLGDLQSPQSPHPQRRYQILTISRQVHTIPNKTPSWPNWDAEQRREYDESRTSHHAQLDEVSRDGSEFAYAKKYKESSWHPMTQRGLYRRPRTASQRRSRRISRVCIRRRIAYCAMSAGVNLGRRELTRMFSPEVYQRYCVILHVKTWDAGAVSLKCESLSSDPAHIAPTRGQI